MCERETIGASSMLRLTRIDVVLLSDFISGTYSKFRRDFVYYYEEIKRELKRIYIYGCRYGCRYDERLKDKTEGSTRLTYTRLCGELGHLKIEKRLIGERFENVMGECVT